MFGYEECTPRQRYDIILDNFDAMYDELQAAADVAERRADFLEQRVDSLLEENMTLSVLLQKQTEATTVAYTQRAIAAIAFAHTVISLGGVAGVGRDGRENQPDAWRVVLYVDTPAGQLSWHIAPHDQHMLEGLPTYAGVWDGTYNSSDASFYQRFYNKTPPNSLHASHKSVRSSDASTFDFICDDCGATDDVTGGWGTLRKPCK